MNSIFTENADIKTFFESKMCTQVCNLMTEFVGNDKFKVGEYKVFYKFDNKIKRSEKINVIKISKNFITYKISTTECPIKKYYNNNKCDDDTIDFECENCRRKKENKTFKKNIFIGDDNIEYCKIDLDNNMGKDHFRIFANMKIY
jgi:hypothetical protein